jgi:flavin reductase (DIM6/NTAB) family NADH-FMN oxidoreductase RutF
MIATNLRQAETALATSQADSVFRNAVFRKAMSLAVTGVNIVTTDGPLGRFGLTVSAVSSVSAEPPMILVCVNRNSPANNAIRSNGVFAINVLGAKQRPTAETFSGSDAHGGAYQFNDRDWLRSITGAPVLNEAVATFDCELETAITAATHTVFIGQVKATTKYTDTPLLYTDRHYGKPASLPTIGAGERPVSGTKTVLERICA